MEFPVKEVYQRLFQHFGPQHWWPAESPFEVIVGALLVQNTSWRSVEKAIKNLKEAGLLDPHKLYEAHPAELESLVRPAGYFRVKVRRLRNFLKLLLEKYGGSLEKMFAQDPEKLRRQLLAINGIGPETADSILLYAGNIPSFVVDAYTKRILARHGWVDYEADYHTIKQLFEESLEPDARVFNEYHALLVALGKKYCKRRPQCEGCPLQELLPPHGPYEPEW